MKISEKIVKLQRGGSLQDNTRVNSPAPKPLYVAPPLTDNGSISKYDKSLRERFMSVMHKLANVGNGAVTGLVAQPALSAGRLLRADKYFKGVQSDSDLGSAVGNLALDAVSVLPFAGKAATEARAIARAAGEGVAPYMNKMKNTYKATADISDPVLRAKNSFWSGTTGKQLYDDRTSRSYFHMMPENTAKTMNRELLNSKPGAVHGELSLSANSSPLFWNQMAKNRKDWKVVRTGEIQEVNLSGMKGKRIEAAIPKQVQTQFRTLSTEVKARQKLLTDEFKKGKISREKYEEQKLFSADMSNEAMMNHMTEDNLKHVTPGAGKSQGYYGQFMESYKPTMDSGIKATNAKTGLNFPMTTIDGIQYSQPTAMAIHKPWQRVSLVAKDALKSGRNNYLLNREIKNSTGKVRENLLTLKGDLYGMPAMKGKDMRDMIRYNKQPNAETPKWRETDPNWVDDIDYMNTSGPSPGDILAGRAARAAETIQPSQAINALRQLPPPPPTINAVY